MPRNCEVKAYVNKDTKEDAKKLFAHWGLSLSDGINALLVCAIDNNGFPQSMRLTDRTPVSKEVIDGIGTIGVITADGRTILPDFMKEDIDEGLYDDLY